MTALLKPHPAAALFPMMSEAELASLEENVKVRGVLEPGVTLDGKLLDGRNRQEVCRRLGIVLPTITWDEWLKRHDVAKIPPPSPTEWVLSKNLERRHLNESQRALIAARALPLLEAEAKKRMSAGGKAGKGAPRGAPLAPPEAPEKLKGRGKAKRASEAAAKVAGASARSVERAKRVLEAKPELAELIASGKKTLKQVEKEIRKEEALKNVLEYRPPVGTFAVIVTDVSWKYDDQLDGSESVRGGVGYATQTLDEILAMKIPAARDCALWFWTTNAFIADGTAGQVVKAWGFKPITVLTWRKVDKQGKDRLGSGHYLRNTTEHAILAIRGKPVVDGGDQPTFFEAPRGKHSEKPDEFFRIAEKVTPCPPAARLELFAIEEREGWVTSGSEQQAKSRAARGHVTEPKPEPEQGEATEQPATKKRRDKMRFVDVPGASA